MLPSRLIWGIEVEGENSLQKEVPVIQERERTDF